MESKTLNNKFNSIINHFIKLHINEKDLLSMTTYFPIDWKITDTNPNILITFICKTDDDVNNLYTVESIKEGCGIDEIIDVIQMIIKFNKQSYEIKLKFEETVRLEKEKYEQNLLKQQQKMINELQTLLTNESSTIETIPNVVIKKEIINPIQLNNEEINQIDHHDDESDEIQIIKA